MDVYKYIRTFASDSDIELEDRDVVRIASVLKTAGFEGAMSPRDQEMARPIVARRFGKIIGEVPGKVKTAEVAEKKQDEPVTMKKEASDFQKIDALVKQGKCARCGKPTSKVKLADYEEVNFCRECRTVLW